MTEEALQHAKPRTIFADHGAGLVGQHFLVGAGLHELANPQAPGVPRRFFRRQCVIGTDHLVAISDVRARSEEQRAIVLHAIEEHIGVAGHDLHVLRSHTVRLGNHPGFIIAYDYFAEIFPGLAGRVRGGKDRQQTLDFFHRIVRKLLGIGDQDGGRGGTVLGLTKQVGRTNFTVHAVIGDDQGLGRPGEKIDSDSAEQLPLGFRHIGVSGAYDHVDRLNRLCAECHGRDGLYATKHVDVVGAAEMHCRDDGRVRSPFEGWRTGDDPFHARNLRSHDRHVCRCDHRIAPARHVTADRIHRDMTMAEHDARQRLDLEVVHRFALLLGEVAYLRLRELNVLEVAFRDLRYRALDFLWPETKILRRPFVDFLRQFVNGRVLPLIDLREDAFDGFAHFGIGSLDRARIHSAFEPAGHGFVLRFVATYRASWPGLAFHITFAKLKRLIAPRVKPAVAPALLRAALLDGLRIDRRSCSARDDQRRAAEEELIDAVLFAVLGKLLEIENFAHAQAHGRDNHPMPGLIGFGRFIRPDFHAPGVRADRGDLLLLAPVTVLELDAWRVAARIAAPFLFGEAAFHLPGADDDKIATSDGHILLLRALIEFVVGNAFAVLHPFHVAKARDIEQYAAPDHLVLGMLDAEHRKSARVDQFCVVT